MLCIIANFTDSTFVVENPKEHFFNLLNQPGYSENGAIGSVRDYYLDNSWNGTESVYRPQFDVYGPVDLSESSKYYDDNGAKYAIIEAYELLQDQISIEDYDTDNDGAIDMVLFYYPGHNQAEGAGEESIWPHQGTGDFGYLGSKQFNRYFCTSELRGVQGAIPAPIGTTCHEFAHSLGLPDFYDTDYEQNGGENFAGGVSHDFDLMSGGNYNDAGRRPPYLSAMERNMLGWMDYPTPITASGNCTLEPIQHNQAYQFATAVEGEYFYMEYRNSEKWDSTLPGGLLVYHVDQSERLVPLTEGCYGISVSAKQLWSTNKLNCFYGHPCYYAVSSTGSITNYGDFLFPGKNDEKTFVPTDWDGNQAGLAFSGIAHDGMSCTFTADVSSHRQIFGYVFDIVGNPIAGAEVSLTPSESPFAAAPSLLSTSQITTTNTEGFYTLELEDGSYDHQILRAWKQGYVAEHTNLSISTLYNHQDMVLLHLGEGLPAELHRFDTSQKSYNLGIGTGVRGVGMSYSADELLAMDAVGALVKSVTFKVGAGAPEGIEATYVIVNFGEERVLCREIPSDYVAGSFVTVDLSDEHLTIPAGTDLIIGYGFTGIVSGYYPFSGFLYATDPQGSRAIADFLDTGKKWGAVSFTNPADTENKYYAGFRVSAELLRVKDVDFSDLGVSYIKVVEDVPTVRVAAGKSLRSTVWYLDGTAQGETAPAISTLEAGVVHQYKVQLTYYDGSSEIVYYDVEVE